VPAQRRDDLAEAVVLVGRREVLLVVEVRVGLPDQQRAFSE
jgi:hypothetical protein